MSQWNQAPTRIQAPPRTEDIKVLRDFVAKLTDIVAIISKDLDFIINGNLDANNIRANSIETKNLKAGSVTADKIEVNELSAITANLGHIISGLIESVQIFGAYIATSQNSYPRAEMSNTENLFRAFRSPYEYVEMAANDNVATAPILKLVVGSSHSYLMQIGNTLNVIGAGGNVTIDGDLTVNLRSEKVNVIGDEVKINNGMSLDSIPWTFGTPANLSELTTQFVTLISYLRATNILA